MPKVRNTYHKGMDRDSSPNNYGEGMYYEARNFRRISEEDLSSGAMNNMLGNTLKASLPVGQNIIGSCPIRDLTVVFTTDCTGTNPGGVDPSISATSSSTGSIYTTNLSDAVPSVTLIKSDVYNFTTKHPIYAQAIGRYERSGLQKVYWADAFNLFRGMNLSDPPSNADEIDIVPSVSFSQPYMGGIGYGALNVGKIQYAYQLYNLNGAESKFSPSSPLYSLTDANHSAATDIIFEGADKLDDSGNINKSGMSVTVKIDDIDTNYDKIKLVSIHYNTVDSTPSINIVSIKDVFSSMTIIDTGIYDLGSMTLNEFRTLGGLLIIPKTIDVKDNMLFVANIKTKYFDVDFDARAYRWRTLAAAKAFLWDTGSAFDEFEKIGGDWPSATYAFKGVTNDLVPEDHNCINPFNYDPSNSVYQEQGSWDDTYWAACKYQSDLSTLGGEGLNVRYSFGNDISLSANNETSLHHRISIDKGTVSPGNDPEDVGNPIGSYNGYSNPYKVAHYLGYKRDEIYRFGVVFFNSKGQESFVKWIGDIRTPTIHEMAPTSSFKRATTTKPLYIFFEIDTSSLSDDVVGYRIVRVKREVKDKTIASSGAISHTIIANVTSGFLDSSDSHLSINNAVVPPALPRERENPYGGATPGANTTRFQNMHMFITPEESYYRNFNYSSGDYFKLAGQLGQRYYIYAYANEGEGHYFTEPYSLDFIIRGQALHKYAFLFGLSFSPSDKVKYSIIEAKSFAPRAWEDIQSPGEQVGTSGYRFINWGAAKGGVGQSGGPASTAVFMETADVDDSHLTGTDSFALYYVDYKKDNANSIYGGIEYTDRELNEYIPAGNYINLQRLSGTKKTGIGTNLDILDPEVASLYPTNSLIGGILVNVTLNDSGPIVANDSMKIYTSSVLSHTGDEYLIIPPKMNLTYVFGGDTYIGMFETAKTLFTANRVDPADDGDIKYEQDAVFNSTISFPCETTINLDIDNGYSFSRKSRDTFKPSEFKQQEVAGSYAFNSRPASSPLIQDKDMYLYNSVYSQQDTSKIFLSKPSDWVEITESDTTIMQSDVKVNNEQIDSWLKFRSENYIDVENSYGPVNRLLRWNNYLMFFQDIGVGTVSVNERQLIPVENNSSLELGRGGVLDRFDMITTGIGCRHKEAILATEFGFYWFDVNKSAMYYYSNALQNVSDVSGLFSEFKNLPSAFHDYKNTIEGNGIMMNKNKRYDEIWLSFIEDGGYNDTFMFNEMTKQFSGTTDNDARYFLNTTRGLFSSKNLGDLYEENVGNYGEFFGTTYDSKLIYIINPNGDIVNVYNNFEFMSELYDSAGNDVLAETFTDIQQLNNYQDSGIIAFVPGVNIRRRIRTWRFYDMRDTSRARFRDSYMKMILRFTNGSNRKFVMHPMNTIYLVPAESLTP